MADSVFNVSKGRFIEFGVRVEANDPANSILVLSVWASTATHATIRDLDTVADIEADANTAELTTNGAARKTFANGTVTNTLDDANDRRDIDVADQTWTGVTGTAWTHLSFGYDSDSTAGTDANVVPMTWHDFAVTPSGADITATIAVFGRAS